MLLFVVAKDEKTLKWLELHHRQAASVTIGTGVPLLGEPNLHDRHAYGVKMWEKDASRGLTRSAENKEMQQLCCRQVD